MLQSKLNSSKELKKGQTYYLVDLIKKDYNQIEITQINQESFDYSHIHIAPSGNKEKEGSFKVYTESYFNCKCKVIFRDELEAKAYFNLMKEPSIFNFLRD